MKTISKWLTGAALATAMLFATPSQKAQAQTSFSFGVNVGGPVYRPYYGYPAYYGYGGPVYVAPPYRYYRPYYGYGYRTYYRPAPRGYYHRGYGRR